MGETPPQELQRRASESYCILHHHVWEENSSTPKVRLVFDASDKTTSGLSHNDCLIVGPTGQPDLFLHVISLRFNQILLSAEVTYMNRQFALEEHVKKFHRNLWRGTPQEPIKRLRLTRLTFGIAF